jgi:hypothetical protein
MEIEKRAATEEKKGSHMSGKSRFSRGLGVGKFFGAELLYLWRADEGVGIISFVINIWSE